MSEIVRNNHYCPQFFLRQWQAEGANGKIWSYPRIVRFPNQVQWKLVSIKHTASLYYLYGITDSENIYRIDNRLEEAMGAVETRVAKILPLVRNNQLLNDEQLLDLVAFAVLQFIRTPAWRERFFSAKKGWELWHRALLTHKLCLYEESIEDKLDYVVRHQFEELFHSYKENVLISPCATVMDDIYYAYLLTGAFVSLLAEASCLDWSILNLEQEIPMSDNPFMIVARDGETLLPNRLFWQPNEYLIMPLTPRHLYVASTGTQARRLDRFYSDLSLIQKLICMNAYDCFYSKIQDLKLSEAYPAVLDSEAYQQRYYDSQSTSNSGISSRDKDCRVVYQYVLYHGWRLISRYEGGNYKNNITDK